ncbi:MAG: retron St85 family RNA-directed DNA polymerase [Clostridia bacterium]|nr:retron St85 family RNA-directed DNA polymerase [Clostridia bacterium]MBQ8893185.1 retron St85 family RNA-directed DNA polymerase [Clostridia bacterium]
MRITEGTVRFDGCDRHFAEKFGAHQAAEMVLDFASTNTHPFLYDTYQLAAHLGLRRKALFELVRRPGRHYRTLRIPKRSGGSRTLSVPDDRLKTVQRTVLHTILCHFPASAYATAYQPGATLRQNAAPHCGKKYLLKLDLEDFFGSIRFDQVYGAVFHTRRFPKQIGAMLTALCCKDDALPQGAPTSPQLSNLVLKWFDDTMGAWCQRRGIAYTRYCDDITFSADRPLYDAYRKAVGLLEHQGFSINEEKTRFVTAAGRQTVTGLTVNEKVGVPADFKRALRQQVYYALKFGAEPPEYRRLLGKVQFVLQTAPEHPWFCDAREELIRRLKG